MVLTIHHLHLSQSERIIWLCEELSIPYELKSYNRDPVTSMAPPEYKALSSSQTAPVITDGDITLAESSACVEYIIHKYGQGKLMVPPSAPNYATFLFWWHYGQGSLQPAIVMALVASALPDAQRGLVDRRKRVATETVDEQLSRTRFIAGDELTAADIICLFYFTTMRVFFPADLSGYTNILRWIREVGGREAYRRALEKGDPGFEPVLGAEAPKSVLSK